MRTPGVVLRIPDPMHGEGLGRPGGYIVTGKDCPDRWRELDDDPDFAAMALLRLTHGGLDGIQVGRTESTPQQPMGEKQAHPGPWGHHLPDAPPPLKPPPPPDQPPPEKPPPERPC